MKYLIYRMKETQREHFRWVAHTGGLASVKLKDYEISGELMASSTYEAWKSLELTEHPLQVGDLLAEAPSGDTPGPLHIFKYIGFEPAQWFVPERRTEGEFIAPHAI